MTTFTQNLGIAQPGIGVPASTNTWGATTNTDWGLVDSAIAGQLTLSVAGSSNVILTSTQGAADQARNSVFVFTGALTGNILVLWPNTMARNFQVANATTGAFTLTVAVNNGSGIAAGTVYAVPQNQRSLLASDGTNIRQQLTDGTQLGLLPLSGGAMTGPISMSQNAILWGGTTGITYNSAQGLVLRGQGSAQDFLLQNESGATIAFVDTGTTVLNFVSDPTSPSILNRSLGSTGFQGLPGGLILQWGTGSTPGGGVVTITYPIPFPSATLNLQLTLIGIGSGTASISEAAANSINFTVIGLQNGSAAAVSFTWFAIGF